MSNSLWLHGLQHAKPPCPTLFLRVCPSSCLLSWWCYPTISSSAALFSFCLQSFPASESLPMTQLTSGGQSTGVSASASVLPMTIQGWFPCCPRDSHDSSPSAILGNSQFINNVVIVSGEQGRDSAIQIHVSILPPTPIPSRLPHNIERSSMCYIVGPTYSIYCWLSILNIAVCTYISILLWHRDKPKNKTDQVYALKKNVNSHKRSISQRLYFLKAKASLISIMDLIADFQREKKC